MKKTIFFVSFIILLLIASCRKPSISSEAKGGFELEFLFEKNGCEVYRFSDAGRFIYWTTCPGDVNYHTGGKSSQYVQSSTNIIR